MEVSGQLHATATSIQGKKPLVHNEKRLQRCSRTQMKNTDTSCPRRYHTIICHLSSTQPNHYTSYTTPSQLTASSIRHVKFFVWRHNTDLVEIWSRHFPNMSQSATTWHDLSTLCAPNWAFRFSKLLEWSTSPSSFNISCQGYHKTVHMATLKEECIVCRSISLHQNHLLSISCDTETLKIRHFNPHWSTSILPFSTSYYTKTLPPSPLQETVQDLPSNDYCCSPGKILYFKKTSLLCS